MAMLAGAGTAPMAPSSARKMAFTVAGLLAVMVILLSAFALPGINTKPKDLPIAVVGAGQPVVSALGKGAAFEVTALSSADDARRKILNRELYGALIVRPGGLTVVTASAASYTVSAALIQAARQLGSAQRLPVTVQDVRPFTSDDPKGTGLSAGALPIALGGWIAAVGIISLIVGVRHRLVTAAAFAVAGGFALTGVLFGLGTFDQNYWALSAAAMLGIAATCFFVLGFERLLRVFGIAIAAVVLVILGNPLSGLTSAPEMLPHPWGALGQFLPPGATGTLLRNVAFFDGAAIGKSLAVLAGWAILGLAAYGLGVLRHRKEEPVELALDPGDAVEDWSHEQLRRDPV